MKNAFFIALMTVATASASTPNEPPLQSVRVIDPKVDGKHAVGRAGSHGWELDYRRDHPGYAFAALHDPILPEPGFYRATFVLRRGHYPKKGLLFKSYGLFRIEVWDMTEKKLIEQRELQIGDFSDPNQYEPRWIEFEMDGREGHAIEPRVYWIGLANGEVESIRVERIPLPDAKELQQKAEKIGMRLLTRHLENGFVVSRKPDGSPDETGDATTYTGFYVASLAWKYAATHDVLTYQALENGLETLHGAVKGTFEEPILVRFIDEEGTPFPKNPSKDVYTAFFLAYSAAYPHITNLALKKQMRSDVDRIASKFLRDGLQIKSGNTVMVSLAPYLSADEIRYGIDKLLGNKKQLHQFVKSLKLSRRILPFGELWPGMKQVIRALERQDAQQCFELVLPTLNGAFKLVERVRDILREQYRADLFPKRFTNREYPGIRLADLLATILKQFPKRDDGLRVQRLSDMKVLASNALISLHIVKTAAVLTKQPQFAEYYRTNLYTQDALLKTALDWHGIEDDLARLAAGNAAADAERRGYLGTLALVNAMSLEQNATVKDSYRRILENEWEAYKNDDNPMISAFLLTATNGKQGSRSEVLRALGQYPDDGVGLGLDYWQEQGKKIAEAVGGGEKNGYSREPLPISYRPRDSFLWQRNARRLSGDSKNVYPGTDYLFVYWYCRAHEIIPAAPPESTAKAPGFPPARE